MPLYMPQLYKKETSRSMTANFYGLNHNLKIADGEWYDMENLTSDHLPVAAVRGKRSKLIRQEDALDLHRAIAMSACNVGENASQLPVYLTEDGILCIADKRKIDLKPYGYTVGGAKKITKMGAYVIVLPDWIYINTAGISDKNDAYEVGRADKRVSWPYSDGNEYVLKITVCDVDGYNANYVSYARPGSMSDAQVQNGDTWFFYGDQDDNAAFMRYDAEKQDWYMIEAYLKISLYKRDRETEETDEIFMDGLEDLRAGDVIRMEGNAVPDQLRKYFGKAVSVAGIETETKEISDGVKKSGVKNFWVRGILQGLSGSTVNLSADQPMIIKRAIPIMDADTVFESKNRLWGAALRYEENVLVNEIYCSARGDLSRWYIGLSDDYDAPITFSVGEGGEWTGGIDHNGVPTFFKEKMMYRVIGSGTSFGIDEIPCDGVERKSKSTLREINGYLYYKGQNHVMRYDGSTPQAISVAVDKLMPEENYWAAGQLGSKYVLVSGEEDGTMLLFDTAIGVWTRERKNFMLMTSAGNNIYAIEDGDMIALKQLERLGDEVGDILFWESDSQRVPWYAESGIIGLETPDEKYITKLAIRLKLEAGAQVRVLVQYDSSGEWEQVMAAEFVGMRTVTVPVHPHRHDHMRYRLEGEGDCQIFSVTKTLERAGRR